MDTPSNQFERPGNAVQCACVAPLDIGKCLRCHVQSFDVVWEVNSSLIKPFLSTGLGCAAPLVTYLWTRMSITHKQLKLDFLFCGIRVGFYYLRQD